MGSIMEAVKMDNLSFEDSTSHELRKISLWVKERFGTADINFILNEYPGFFTRLLADIRKQAA